MSIDEHLRLALEAVKQRLLEMSRIELFSVPDEELIERFRNTEWALDILEEDPTRKFVHTINEHTGNVTLEIPLVHRESNIQALKLKGSVTTFYLTGQPRFLYRKTDNVLETTVPPDEHEIKKALTFAQSEMQRINSEVPAYTKVFNERALKLIQDRRAQLEAQVRQHELLSGQLSDWGFEPKQDTAIEPEPLPEDAPQYVVAAPVPLVQANNHKESNRRVRSSVDVAILTVLSEEYGAVRSLLNEVRSAPSSARDRNIYAWVLGSIQSHENGGDYRVALGMLGRAGNTQGALGMTTAIRRWRPRYVFLVGIAGGFDQHGLEKGDVVFSDTIYGYEYGKLDTGIFITKLDWVYRADQGLLTGASKVAESPTIWAGEMVTANGRPIKALAGKIASGDKVVDDPNVDFFQKVLEAWPNLHAVEMEGAGAAAAVEAAQANGQAVGYMMIRGISDQPRPPSSTHSYSDVEEGIEPRGTQERDEWKKRAAQAAASFTIGLISSGLPTPPKQASKKRSTESISNSTPVSEDELSVMQQKNASSIKRFATKLYEDIKARRAIRGSLLRQIEDLANGLDSPELHSSIFQFEAPVEALIINQADSDDLIIARQLDRTYQSLMAACNRILDS